MKRKRLFGIYFLVFIFMVSLVSAKEYSFDAGDIINYEGKTIRLALVGSSGAAIVEVDGVTGSIPRYNAKIVNGLEIHVVSSYWVDNQAARSAVLDIQIPGEICHVDNFCDYREISNLGGTQYYRGKTIEIIEAPWDHITLKIDGKEVTINAPYPPYLPLDTVDMIDGIGLRYNIFFDSELLYLGENFDNCPSDCPLNREKDIRLIKDFCQDGEQNEISGEEGIDCGGICERDCSWECVEHEECIDKCNIIENSELITCLCENNECIDRTYCKFDSDCVQVQNDLCGCDFISINREYKSIWDNGINQIFSSKSCLSQCSYVEYNPICQNNKCVLSTENSKNNLYTFIDNIVNNGDYTIVLGDDAPSMDTLAASELNLKFQQYSDLKTNLPVELASRIKNKNNLILIGHPCDNPLITQPACDLWSYGNGQSLIKINGNNLIIAGTTPEDTRNAAKIIANYRDHAELREKSEIIIGEKIDFLKIEKQAEQESDSEDFEVTTSEEPSSEENQTEQIKEKREYKGILHRFISWIISLFR